MQPLYLHEDALLLLASQSAGKLPLCEGLEYLFSIEGSCVTSTHALSLCIRYFEKHSSIERWSRYWNSFSPLLSEVYPSGISSFEKSVDLSVHYEISITDALHLSIMREYGVTWILSLPRNFESSMGIRCFSFDDLKRSLIDIYEQG